MNIRPLYFRLLLLLLGSAYLLSGSLHAQKAEAEKKDKKEKTTEQKQAPAKTLENYSPFIPEGYNKKAAPPPAREKPVSRSPIERDVELRGIFTWKGITKVSLYNKKKARSKWLAQGESFEEVTVLAIDNSKQTAKLSKGNQTAEMGLKKRSTATLAIKRGDPTNQQAKPPVPGLPQVDNKAVNNVDPNGIARRRRVIIPRRKPINTNNNNNSKATPPTEK